MIRVRTGSRLHFGFFRLPSSEERWPNRDGELTLGARAFGGVGLMLVEPAVQVRFEPAGKWTAEGPLADRALRFALTASEHSPGLQPGQIIIEECPPVHMGLGVGTQLGLAVARAITATQPDLDAMALARLVGRGARSALGIHGFERGGFLVEAGKRSPEEIAPLVCRLDFPDEWRILLILPPWGRGLAGAAEVDAMRRLQQLGQPLADTDALCRLVLLGMLPALVERDLAGFGESLYEFNRRVGEWFRPVQGGVYAHPRSAEVVEFLRREGVRGVGQSSWGPALFAVTDADGGLSLGEKLRRRFDLRPGDLRLVSALANDREYD